MATILSPASLASQGQISGIGLAQKKPMAFLAIFFNHSGLMVSGPDLESEIQTSAPYQSFGDTAGYLVRIGAFGQVPFIGIFLLFFFNIFSLGCLKYRCYPPGSYSPV